MDVLGATEGSHRRPALVLLHGSGGNVDFWLSRLEPALAEAGVLLFAPHYFERTGTSRADMATITDGVHVPLWLEALGGSLAHVAANPKVDSDRIAVVGISLSAYLALSWTALQSAGAAMGGCRIRCLIELSGGLPEPYASEATARMPPTLLLHGEQDTVVPVSEARALNALLTRLGVAHEVKLLPGEGHWFSAAAQWQLLLAVSGFLSRYLQG